MISLKFLSLDDLWVCLGFCDTVNDEGYPCFAKFGHETLGIDQHKWFESFGRGQCPVPPRDVGSLSDTRDERPMVFTDDGLLVVSQEDAP